MYKKIVYVAILPTFEIPLFFLKQTFKFSKMLCISFNLSKEEPRFFNIIFDLLSGFKTTMYNIDNRLPVSMMSGILEGVLGVVLELVVFLIC